MVVVGDRVIGSIVVLSRGALDELLDRIIRRELKPLHPCIMFLGSCLILFVSLRAYVHLDDKLEFIENGVHMPLLLRFRCCSFYRSYSRKGSHHFLMVFFSFASY